MASGLVGDVALRDALKAEFRLSRLLSAAICVKASGRSVYMVQYPVPVILLRNKTFVWARGLVILPSVTDTLSGTNSFLFNFGL